MSLLALEYLRRVVFDLVDSAEHRVVLFCLFDHADDHGRRMFPSVTTLARACRREPAFVEGVVTRPSGVDWSALLPYDVVAGGPRAPPPP
jgi:hypothetical protein